MTRDTKSQAQTVTLAGGCFWCLEAAYNTIRGVTAIIPGYAGGTQPDPTYEQVCGGTTGHAEVVQVSFDSAIITLQEILEIFWAIHDPTTPNRQGSDVGTQYRSMILYTSQGQKQIAEDSIKAVAKLWPNPIVTELVPLQTFYPAEEYHRNYFERHPSQAYCQVVINPKLKHLREQFTAKLKTA
jgi:peptide-methionine (S)-S-oxide reductase